MTGYAILVGGVAVQRLLELDVSRRHERALEARGGIEHASHQMRWFRILHGSWLVSCLAEPVILDRPFNRHVAIVAALVFAAGQTLRWLARRELGERWTTTIVTLPGAARIRTGIFGYVSHPNYVGVALEIASLPMIHGAWITAVVFSVLKAALLAWRIRAEERALAGTA